jgi:hypothetical protein
MRSKVESSFSRGAVNMNRFDKMQKQRLITQMTWISQIPSIRAHLRLKFDRKTNEVWAA